MKERKLEVKDICGYLPYNLRVKWGVQIKVMNTGPGSSGYWIGIGSLIKWFNSEMIEKPIPILRPVSDLYETIKHNKKEIIPIVELAKIASPYYQWEYFNKTAIVNNDNKKGFLCKFSFCEAEQYFIWTKNDGAVKHLPNLFDFLHELHIDYRGLINDGLALNCYELENNPFNYTISKNEG